MIVIKIPSSKLDQDLQRRYFSSLLDVMDEFFAEHWPKHCSYNNPPPSEVIGVAALAHPDLVVQIVAIAALPD
jgi:enamine deaminase RidA (YjgF/YER057c/UK114 family)